MMQARRGFLRPRDFSYETIQADLISKSSSFLSSIYCFMYSINFCNSSLPNSSVAVSNSCFADCYFFFYYTYYFLLAPFLVYFTYQGFYYFFYFLPVAMFLGMGGVLRMQAVSLCLLSRTPVKGQESHLPVITLSTTSMCISGSLHLGQQIYFSMNLSKHFNISLSLNSPLMIQLVLFLPPAYLNVVWEAFSKPKNLRMQLGSVRRCLATSVRLTMLVFMPFPFDYIFSCIFGMR